jgi:hypothetical protein
MPLEMTLPQKRVEITQEVSHFIELYKQTANRLQLDINTDQRIKNRTLWAQLMVRTVERFGLLAGGRSLILDEITVHFDRPSEILFEHYQSFLTAALLAQGVNLRTTEEAFDRGTGEQIITNKYVLVWELLIRLVARSLDVSILGNLPPI